MLLIKNSQFIGKVYFFAILLAVDILKPARGIPSDYFTVIVDSRELPAILAPCESGNERIAFEEAD